MVRITISDLYKMKERGERITMVTAYDYPSAKLVDKSGIDLILVGDSVGMVVMGYDTPLPVTVDDIIHHTQPVARGACRSLIVGDMPFMAYHVSVEDTVRNAGRIIKEGSANAVKMEGGKEIYEKVKTLVEVGIHVQAHLGLMPQKASISDRFRVQGNTAETAAKIIKDALLLEEAGAFSVVLEFVTAEVAKIITEKLSIPTIGIGSGPYCDGQVLVLHDLLGIYENLPPFAKKYADLHNIILDSLKKYHEEVRNGAYPASEHTINMNKDELRKLESKINEY